MVFSLFGSSLVLLHLHDCKGEAVLAEGNVLEFCGGTYSEEMGKLTVVVASSDQINL